MPFFGEPSLLHLQWRHMWHKAMRNRGKDMGDGVFHGCELGKQGVGDTLICLRSIGAQHSGASPAN